MIWLKKCRLCVKAEDAPEEVASLLEALLSEEAEIPSSNSDKEKK